MDKKSVVERKIHEEKAHRIVIKLAIETVDETTLLSIIRFIEPYHYEEIIEERFLSKICGYPICNAPLKKIPPQKYQISSKLNKVYDIADRKRYCSGQCYKSSKYLETQVSKVPIWLRSTSDYLNNEGSKQIRLFSQVNGETKKVHDDYDLKFNQDKHALKTNSSKTSEFLQIQDKVICKSQLYSSEIENELNNIENQWRSKFNVEKTNYEMPLKMKDPLQKHSIFKHVNVSETKNELYDMENRENIKHSEVEKSTEPKNINKKFLETTKIHEKPLHIFHMSQIFKVVKDPLTAMDNETICVDPSDENTIGKYFFIEYLINRIRDLLSEKTKDYINDKNHMEKSKVHVERQRLEYVKKCDEFVVEKSVFFDDLTNDENQKPSLESGENLPNPRDINLLKDLDDNGEAEMLAKLELLGLGSQGSSEAEKKDEEQSSNDHQFKKPMPNYNDLQVKAKDQQLRIKEFFMGDPHSAKAKKIKELDELKSQEEEMSKDESNFSAHSFKTRGMEGQDVIRVLPTVDSQSQAEIRRKIFMEKLIKYMDQLLKFSDFSTGDVKLNNHIKNFVFSLKFNNQNILFNTNEWPIVALFLLKILSMKHMIKSEEADYQTLSEKLQQLIEKSKLVETILTSFKLDLHKFELICKYLVN